MITSPTKIVITKEDIIGFKPKLEFNVLDMLSIWGILPEPKVETKRQKEKTRNKSTKKLGTGSTKN